MPKHYATGKSANAVFICDRSGKKYPRSKMVREPGTGLFVHWAESDGPYNAVDHPQNYPPKDITEAVAVRWARPDRNEVANDDTLIADSDGNILIFGASAGYNDITLFGTSAQGSPTV